MTTPFSESDLDVVKTLFFTYVKEGTIQDFAFLGGASRCYRWRPSANAEIDVCIFVKDFSLQSGNRIKILQSSLADTMKERQIHCEFRVIRGPYKQTPEAINSTTLTIHAALFTRSNYILDAAPLLRWSWRKYECFRDPMFLANASGDRPSKNELLNGRLGILHRLSKLEARQIIMEEQIFPTFEWRPLFLKCGSNMFYEYCIACVANTARNHSRVLGHDEADTLDNPAFFEFYSTNVFTSESFRKLMEIKARTRDEGYHGLDNFVLELSIDYLTSLANLLTET